MTYIVHIMREGHSHSIRLLDLHRIIQSVSHPMMLGDLHSIQGNLHPITRRVTSYDKTKYTLNEKAIHPA